MKKIALFLFGLPCSGKSTWYEKNIKPSFPPHKYINADDIKFEFHDYREENESMYVEEAIEMARVRAIAAFNAGDIVVFDAGAINGKYTNRLLAYAKSKGYYTSMTFVNTPYEICLERNSKRTRKVPEQIILDKEVKKMSIWQGYTKSEFVDHYDVIEYYTEQNLFLDMDGVLAVQSDLPVVNGKIDFVNSEHFRHLAVVPQVAEIVEELGRSKRKEIYILSAAPTSISAQEKYAWLRENFPFIKKENIFFVNSGKYKAEMFSDLHKRLKLDPRTTCLIEDTHTTIKQVRREYKMHSLHVSEFLQKYAL